jgi:hypothetical protein
VEATRGFLGLEPEFRSQLVSSAELRFKFDQFRSEIRSEVGDEPGSESLAIFIQTTYPRG